MDIISDKFGCFFLLCVLLQSGLQNVSIYHGEVVFTFPVNGLGLILFICGHILEKYFPDSCSVLDGYTIPCEFFEFLNIDDFLIEMFTEILDAFITVIVE